MTAAGESKRSTKANEHRDKQFHRTEFRVLIDEMAVAGVEKAVSIKRRCVYGKGFKRADANGYGVCSVPELNARK
jgi:hypothetical protein